MYAPSSTLIQRQTEVISVSESLWRVIRTRGELLGYVDRIPTPEGDKFRVRRVLPTQRRFISLGEFWRFDDAIACFRF